MFAGRKIISEQSSLGKTVHLGSRSLSIWPASDTLPFPSYPTDQGKMATLTTISTVAAVASNIEASYEGLKMCFKILFLGPGLNHSTQEVEVVRSL